MGDENRLGNYLRARRELVAPAMVGLPAHGVRRVPGLRREEVAMLAGVSSDYYLRLEQGRDRNPSLQVLEALSRVLQLDAAATTYLRQLPAPLPRRQPQEGVPAAAAQLLETIGLHAFVTNRYFDVLACNPLMTALEPSVRVGENRLRSAFLDRDEQARHDVKFPGSKPVRMDHPQVGELSLRLSKLELEGMPLIVYHPAPASRDARRLAVLAAA